MRLPLLPTLLMVPAIVLAHGIEVGTPDGKAVWTKGEKQKIQWKAEKVEAVHLELIQVATKKRLPVAKDLKNTGEFEWKVAADLVPGSYRVLVISTKDQELHGVSAIFEVR